MDHTGTIRRSSRRRKSTLLTAATVVGGLAAFAAPAGAFTGTPVWNCRGSALSVSVAGMNRVEPEVANGNPNTGNGASPDFAQCANATVGAGNLATPVGLPSNFLAAPTAYADTVITPELGTAISQTAVANGGVENLALQLPPGGGVTLGVGAANATATAKCVNGAPALSGTSQAVNVTLGGQPISLDQLLTGLSNALAPLNMIVSLKVNEQVTTATSLEQRALHITVLNGGTGAPVADIIIGVAKVGFSGGVCNPNDQYPPQTCSTAADFDCDGDANGDTDNDGDGTGTSTSANSMNDNNGNIGSATGPPAFCGHLKMYFVSTHKLAATSVFGKRTVLRGRLVSCGRHPRGIVGARIDVIHIVHGKRHLLKTGMKSRGHGLLTLIEPLNLTTRTIEFDYRGHLRSRHVTSRQVAHLTVRSRFGAIVR